MKIITAITLLLLFSNCGSGKTETDTYYFEENPPFRVETASYQQWVAGTPQGGSGVNVFINFSNIQQGVIFKKLYFRDKQTDVVTSAAVRVQYVGYFKNEPKRDVLMDSNYLKEAVNTPPNKIPFQLNNDEAVISYEFNKEIAYFKIENLEQKEILAYPASNPKGDN
ncbi:hypothetical protein [Rasiella sp. SM2506]|uniref:hypothetical protein n=1 Tax=Rasiella sp. SM2506 TaxID=3423914 RepID=UPI003D7AC07B